MPRESIASSQPSPRLNRSELEVLIDEWWRCFEADEPRLPILLAVQRSTGCPPGQAEKLLQERLPHGDASIEDVAADLERYDSTLWEWLSMLWERIVFAAQVTLPESAGDRFTMFLTSLILLPASIGILWAGLVFGKPKRLAGWLVLLAVGEFGFTLFVMAITGFLWSLLKPEWLRHPMERAGIKLVLLLGLGGLTMLIAWNL